MSSNKVLSSNKTAKKKHGNERAHQLKVYSVGSVLILLAIVLLMNILLDVFLIEISLLNAVMSYLTSLRNFLTAFLRIPVSG